MAHDIAIINGKNAIAYVGETPWHRLGTAVPAGISLPDALIAASLDWNVKALPAFATIDGVQTPLPVQAVIRETDNAVLGTVGPRWQAIQHRDAFRLFEPAIEAGQLRIDVLGALGNGATVWLLLKLAEEAQAVRTLPNGQPDVVLPYINAALAHDGTRSFTVQQTGVRVVCRNTLGMADDAGQFSVSIRHSSNNVEGQLKAVGAVIEKAAKQYRETMAVYRQLAGVTITEAELVDYIAAVLPLPTKPVSLVKAASEGAAAIAAALVADAGITVDGSINDAKLDETLAQLEARYKTQVAQVEAERVVAAQLATTGFGNDGSSLWDAYNGVTEFVDHTARRDTEYAKERAAINAVAGSGKLVKGRALVEAVKRADLVAA